MGKAEKTSYLVNSTAAMSEVMNKNLVDHNDNYEIYTDEMIQEHARLQYTHNFNYLSLGNLDTQRSECLYILRQMKLKLTETMEDLSKPDSPLSVDDMIKSLGELTPTPPCPELAVDDNVRIDNGDGDGPPDVISGSPLCHPDPPKFSYSQVRPTSPSVYPEFNHILVETADCFPTKSRYVEAIRKKLKPTRIPVPAMVDLGLQPSHIPVRCGAARPRLRYSRFLPLPLMNVKKFEFRRKLVVTCDYPCSPDSPGPDFSKPCKEVGIREYPRILSGVTPVLSDISECSHSVMSSEHSLLSARSSHSSKRMPSPPLCPRPKSGAAILRPIRHVKSADSLLGKSPSVLPTFSALSPISTKKSKKDVKKGVIYAFSKLSVLPPIAHQRER